MVLNLHCLQLFHQLLIFRYIQKKLFGLFSLHIPTMRKDRKILKKIAVTDQQNVFIEEKTRS